MPAQDELVRRARFVLDRSNRIEPEDIGALLLAMADYIVNRAERIEIDAARIAELEFTLQHTKHLADRFEPCSAHFDKHGTGDRCMLCQRDLAREQRDSADNKRQMAEARATAAEARLEEAKAVVQLLVADVADYEAWQRPVYALDKARAFLKEPHDGR
jgi:hypothetical protein